MKKSVLLALFGAASVAAYGQGLVNFSNYAISTQLNGITYANGPSAGLGVGPEISVQLLYGASTDTLISELTPLNFNDNVGDVSPVAAGNGNPAVTGPGAIGIGAGWFSGGAVLIPGTAGSTYAFALYAFGTSAGGPNGNGLFSGYSGIFTGATQASSSVGVPTLPNGLYQGSFTVSETIVSSPEPSSLALAGLGGFGMLMAFRRKKA